MNKKGQGMSLNTVVKIVLLGALLVLLIVMVPRAIRRVYKGVETAEEVSMAQLEELRKIAEEKKEEHIEEVVEVKGYLVDAINFISGKGAYYEYKGSKVGGGTNIDYDKAIEKYIEHYKKCGTEKPPGCLPDEGTRLRVLNVLREKFFVLTLTKPLAEVDIEGTKFDTKNYAGLISKKEFESAVFLSIISAHIKKADYETAKKFREDYNKDYRPNDQDRLNIDYNIALGWYLYVKTTNKEKFKPNSCNNAKQMLINVIDYTNKGLSYEKTFITDFTALDYYQFLNVPNQEVRQICEKIS